MSQTSTQVTTTPGTPPLANRRKSQSRGFFAAGFARFFGAKINLIALVIFAIISVICYSSRLIGDNILHQNRDEIDFNLLIQGLQPPVGPGVGGHILGTDELGRDLLLRVLAGGQVSLSVGFLAALFSVVLGTTLGLVGGYYGGKIDDAVNALVQIIFNVPSLFLLIVLSLFFKPDILSLSIIIGALSWPGGTRQIRGQVLSLRNREYVDATRVMGASNFRILFIHILPNVISTMLVVAGFDVVGAMLTESGLSFLGFGISVPIPSWGNMLSDSQLYITGAPWMVYAPALAFFVTVLCVYLIADGLRDAFDPRLRDR
jgi:peptide/nickel transport system permease protein